MISIIIFYMVFALAALSAICIFLLKKLSYAVIALSLVFLGSSFVFLLINQDAIALLQLLVLVGGLSTYLIVAVSTEEHQLALFKPGYFVIALISLFLSFSILFNPSFAPQISTEQALDFAASAGAAIASGYALLYIAVAMLFVVVVGAVVVLKEFTELIV